LKILTLHTLSVIQELLRGNTVELMFQHYPIKTMNVPHENFKIQNVNSVYTHVEQNKMCTFKLHLKKHTCW